MDVSLHADKAGETTVFTAISSRAVEYFADMVAEGMKQFRVEGSPLPAIQRMPLYWDYGLA